MHSKHYNKVPALIQEIQGYLVEGVITEEYLLDNLPKLLNCCRNANVSLRWLMLHNETKHKKSKEAINVPQEMILDLLLFLAQFEFVMKNMFKNLLSKKQGRWDDLRKGCCDRYG